jgi:hypothetical protein
MEVRPPFGIAFGGSPGIEVVHYGAWHGASITGGSKETSLPFVMLVFSL